MLSTLRAMIRGILLEPYVADSADKMALSTVEYFHRFLSDLKANNAFEVFVSSSSRFVV